MNFYKERKKHPLVLNVPALLIVDVQSYFTDRESSAYLEGIENIYENIKKLSERFLQKGYPVISTIHKGGALQMQRWWGNKVDENWAKPYFKSNEYVYIIKDTYDAFYNTYLEKVLRLKNVTDIIITGVMTHLCCETTARSGFVRNFNVVMVEDALWDKDEFYHFLSLKSLAHGFAHICKTEEVLCKLE
jgi:isochorismate hydrolase